MHMANCDIISGMKDYEKYMTDYWVKYPNEKELDYSLNELALLIKDGASYYLTKYMFVVYITKEDKIDILFYCIDGGGFTRSKVKEIYSGHREFVSKFDKPVYIDNVNDLFKRDKISQYDKHKKQWRFL